MNLLLAFISEFKFDTGLSELCFKQPGPMPNAQVSRFFPFIVEADKF